MSAKTYVLADTDGRLHMYLIDEDDELEIPEGWTWMPGENVEAKFWAQGHDALERFQQKVTEVRADQVVSDLSAPGRQAVVSSVEARLGLEPGTLTAALPPPPET